MRRPVFAVATLVAALACGGESEEASGNGQAAVVEAAYGEPFDLELGARALVGGEFGVRFDRVAEDSRCPEAARCLQAGNGAAAFAVESEAGRATLTLNTDREPRRAAAAGRELRMVELDPRPRADAPPDTSAYVATVIVSPAP